MNQNISTQWPFSTTAQVQGNSVIPSVVLVVNLATSQKGTGWLVSEKYIVTNAVYKFIYLQVFSSSKGLSLL